MPADGDPARFGPAPAPPGRARPRSLARRLGDHAPLRRAIVLLVLACLWEGYGRVVDNDLLFPTFLQTLAALWTATASGELPDRILTSLRVLAMGYGIGVAVAAILTCAAVSTRTGADVLTVLTAMFNPLPAIALLPVALLWFGLGAPSLVVVIAHSVLWAVALNTYSGFRAVSPTLRLVGHNVGLRGIRHVVLILVPAAFPAILSGLKIGWAFAWRTLIAAELVFGVSSRSGGIGWFLFEHRNQLDIASVFAGLLAVIAIGLTVEGVIFRAIEQRTVIRWGMQR